jgi:hypothetical protein
VSSFSHTVLVSSQKSFLRFLHSYTKYIGPIRLCLGVRCEVNLPSRRLKNCMASNSRYRMEYGRWSLLRNSTDTLWWARKQTNTSVILKNIQQMQSPNSIISIYRSLSLLQEPYLLYYHYVLSNELPPIIKEYVLQFILYIALHAHDREKHCQIGIRLHKSTINPHQHRRCSQTNHHTRKIQKSTSPYHPTIPPHHTFLSCILCFILSQVHHVPKYCCS